MLPTDDIGKSIVNQTIDVTNVTVLRAALYLLLEQTHHTNESLQIIQTNSDNFFLTVNAVFILMMQAGFGFFEAGSVRSKNVINMLLKNVLDAFIGGFSYWIFGYAFAFGEPHCNGFLGFSHFFGTGLKSTHYSQWFFHYSFCVTAATIVSGSVAERCEFKAYLVYSMVITGFTYPIITHWAWHNGGYCRGWLNSLGYQDFAGSGVVHMTGGTCAMIGSIVLGPRLGRFPDYVGGPHDPMPGHNVSFVVMGAFLLFVGFFAFNGGSQASISVSLDGEQAGRAMMNTVLAASPAATVGCLLYRFFTPEKTWDLIGTLGTALAGMVAICAGCNEVEPWAAVIIGGIAAVVVFAVQKPLKAFHIDDPVDAIPVHLGAGLWGVIAAPLFDRKHGVLLYWNRESFLGLSWNLIGAITIAGWCVLTTLPVFLVLRYVNWLRVKPEVEIAGMDIIKHGEYAYPEQIYCKHCMEHFITSSYKPVDPFFEVRKRKKESLSINNGRSKTPISIINPTSIPNSVNGINSADYETRQRPNQIHSQPSTN